MTAVPVVGLFAAGVALGILLMVLRLFGVRRPIVGWLHLGVGAGGLAGFAWLIRSMSAHGAERTQTGVVAGGFLAAAWLMGVTFMVLAGRTRSSADIVLATHATLGAAGFLLLLGWAAGS